MAVDGQSLYMKSLSRRLTSHCTPRKCSATLPAMFNLGDEDTPLWFSVDTAGVPARGPPPQQFPVTGQFSRIGVPAIIDHGIYSQDQRDDMSAHSQRQDASEHVLGHITNAVTGSDDSIITAFYENTLPTRNFQQRIERSTTPFPYNLFNFLPKALRTVLIIILLGFLIKGILWIILPLVSLCNSVRDGVFD